MRFSFLAAIALVSLTGTFARGNTPWLGDAFEVYEPTALALGGMAVTMLGVSLSSFRRSRPVKDH